MMHRKQKASFAHISRSEGITALKPGVNLPLKEKKKQTKIPLSGAFSVTSPCTFCSFHEATSPRNSPSSLSCPTRQSTGGPTALAQLWVSLAEPWGATLHPCPLLLLAGTARVNQHPAPLPTELPTTHPAETDTDGAAAQQPHPRPYSLAIP